MKVDKKKKLVIAISSSIGGGAQKLMIDIAPYLSEKYDLLVVCPEGFLSKKLEDENIHPIISEINFRTMGSIKAKIDEWAGNEEFILNPYLFGTAFYFLWAFRNWKNKKTIPLLLNPIIRSNQPLQQKVLYKMIAKFIGRRTDRIIVGSPELADEIYRYTKKTAFYLENRVPNIDIEKQSIYSGIGDGSFKVCFVGRMAFQKRPDIFVRMAKLLYDDGVNTLFYMAGKGELLEENIRYVEENGLQDVVFFIGFVDDLYKLLNSMDALVCTSAFENTPLIILNCMNVGLPVIAGKVPGIPHLICNGEDGLMVDNLTPSDFKDAVVRLAKDRELYFKIRNNSIKKSRTVFSYEKFVNKYIDILENNDCGT